MKKSKIIGASFTIIAIIFCINFMIQPDFSIRLESYFDFDYLMKLTPLVIGLMLFLGGAIFFINPDKANFTLSLFGHTAVEEIVFNWFGLSASTLSNDSTIVFFICGVIALWIAYSNAFNTKKLSFFEAVVSLIFGGVIAFF